MRQIWSAVSDVCRCRGRPAALELQMWTSRGPSREENMQNEMKTPTYGLGGVTDAGQRTESAALGWWLKEPTFRRGGGGGHSQQVLLVQPCASWLCQCQGGLSREFYQGLLFSFFLQSTNTIFVLLHKRKPRSQMPLC